MVKKATYIGKEGKQFNRHKCSITGCRRFKALRPYKLKDGTVRKVEMPHCGVHRKDGSTYICYSFDNQRLASWKRQGFQITIDKYDELLKKQNNQCALCGRHCSEFFHLLSVDHDHKSGRIRGLLCYSCNLRLGWLETTIGLKKIMWYLRKKVTP